MSSETSTVSHTGEQAGHPFGEPLPGAVVAERYELVEQLGTGGSAVVYRARDRLLGHDIALKILHTDRIGPAGLARLRREAAIARQVTSPHLVRVFDVGAAEPLHFLTMEHVAGGTLRERLRPGGPPPDGSPRSGLPLATVLAWSEQLLAGLAVLHTRAVAHRDVKPGNLLLAEDGTLKLADLGLARHLGGEETRATIGDRLLGTWDYLAPEQVAGQDGDARSDLYATGVVLFEMLAGTPPFGQERSLGALMGRLRGHAPRVRRLRRDCPRWLDRFVARLLEPLPARRFADARQALDAFRARRTPLSLRRGAVLLGAALAVATVGVGVWTIRPVVFGASRAARFSHLAQDGDRGVVALDRGGNTLWRLPGVDPGIAERMVTMRLTADARPVLAGVLRRPGDNDPARMRVLSLLDPENGAVLGSVELRSGAAHYSEYPDRYHPERLLARDLDGDGVDELLATYYLESHAPSYTVLYEPALRRSRILFAASGYHRIEDLVDVDGDGRQEAIILGTNNRMGWFNAAVAVSIEPWIGAEPGFDAGEGTVLSPDRSPALRPPLWYALLPRGYTASEPARKLRVNAAGRRFVVGYRGGRADAELGFDGFLAAAYRHPLAERRRRRDEAYAALRDTLRLLAGGSGTDTLAAARRGREAARLAEDPLLERVLARFEAKALAAAGELAAAERTFAQLAAGAEDASEVAHEAATALHLAGALDRALAWYERGLGPGASAEAGKPKIAFLAGTVFVHLERGATAPAGDAIQRFRAQFPEWTQTLAVYREVVRWHAGLLPETAHLRIAHNQPDTLRYFGLELRNACGEDATTLLAEVRAELGQSYDSVGGLHSLAGVLLERLGRREEAAVEHAQAVDWLSTWSHRDPNLRLVLALADSRARAAAPPAFPHPATEPASPAKDG